jgi:GGDEF domain-containing protein
VGKAHRLVAHQGSASVGVVVFSSHHEPQATLFSRADAAMYQAKNSGRNAVMFSDDDS